jgi:hypothetical protein
MPSNKAPPWSAVAKYCKSRGQITWHSGSSHAKRVRCTRGARYLESGANAISFSARSLCHHPHLWQQARCDGCGLLQRPACEHPVNHLRGQLQRVNSPQQLRLDTTALTRPARLCKARAAAPGPHAIIAAAPGQGACEGNSISRTWMLLVKPAACGQPPSSPPLHRGDDAAS